MFGATFSLLQDGVHDDAVPSEPHQADDAKDDREADATVGGSIFSWNKTRTGPTAQ